MHRRLFRNGRIILPDGVAEKVNVLVDGDRIAAVAADPLLNGQAHERIDLGGRYLTPGFIDLHVHGGAGADFMDGTEEAFHTVCQAHLRHGTTALLPTTTCARHDQHLAFLRICQKSMRPSTAPRILGAHFYGPYFSEPARGCHPAASIRPPVAREYEEYLAFADVINRATVAPELPGAKDFVRACRKNHIHCNAGHTLATFEQMQAAIEWGITHVDHLFCAMSDRARLRQSQTYPMRGGVLEAALYFDELTTEVIADGKHLQRELLLLAYKIKGPGRLALVTDCNRALDMPDGEYIFGPHDGGERILRRDGVGIMPDGQALASGVVGMDYCVRTFHQQTGVPLHEVVRMASLTPARIAHRDQVLGSIEPGKFADLLVLDAGLNVQAVFVGGRLVHGEI